MLIKANNNHLTASKIATQQYIASKNECRRRHEAYVVTSVHGKEQHGVRFVSANASLESAEVIIEELHTICGHHTNRFTPENDDFVIINNKTLQIRPKSSICGPIVIEITAK